MDPLVSVSRPSAGSTRRAELLFQNVRELGYESYRPNDGMWRVLIDYPFDEPPHARVGERCAGHERFRPLARTMRVDRVRSRR